MKKIILFLLLFYSIQVSLYAQDSSRSAYRITTSVIQDAQLYFNLSFEKVITKNKTMGVSLGFRPILKDSGKALSGDTGGWSTYQMNNFQNNLYSSFTIDLFMKFYFGHQKKSFLMPDVYYRVWWFDEKDCWFTGYGGIIKNHYQYSYDGIRTEQQHLIGLKVLYGRTYKINKNGSFRPVIEPYAGMGLFVKSYTFQTYNGTVNDVYYNYHKETGIGLYPSFHVGLNVGFEFAVKNKK